MKSNKLIFTTMALFMLTASAAISKTTNPLRPPAEVKTYKNLDASLALTYFSLETGAIVKDTEISTSNWDIAFNKTQIVVNSGASGKGNAVAQVLKSTDFDKVTEAPADGYKSDTDEAKAIPTGSGNGWYKYNMANHAITPAEGVVIVIKTTSGKYAKLQILDYNDSGSGATGFYTFRYAVQADGSKNFK